MKSAGRSLRDRLYLCSDDGYQATWLGEMEKLDIEERSLYAAIDILDVLSALGGSAIR